MSITSISNNSDMIHNKQFQHRKASKELEVFEAARYFSDYNEAAAEAAAAAANLSSTIFTQKVKKKKEKGWIKGRISLDIHMPVKNLLNLPPRHYNNSASYTSFDHQNQKSNMALKEKINKFKQQPKPSSPGGKLASFLNSLFSHYGNSKKKNKTKSSVQSMEDDDEDEIPDHGISSKRRISISHFRSSNADNDHHVLQTPTKSYKELLSFSKFNRHLRSATSAPLKPAVAAMDERRERQKVEVEDKGKLRDGVLEKEKKKENDSEKNRIWTENFEKFNDEIDDGNETDSSSDLFELQIYDLDYYSKSGLPVYESTDIDSIKRRNSISNGFR